MKIHFNKALGITILVLGGLDILMILFFALAGARINLGGFFIVLATALGILYLTRTYFVVGEKELEVKALIGPTTVSFPFTSPKDFSVEKWKIFLVSGDERQQLPVYGWMADRKDWKAFVRWTETGERPPGSIKKG